MAIMEYLSKISQSMAIMEYLSRISQSMAIMEYLNDISGGKLMPADPKLKAQVYYDLKMTQNNMEC